MPCAGGADRGEAREREPDASSGSYARTICCSRPLKTSPQRTRNSWGSAGLNHSPTRRLVFAVALTSSCLEVAYWACIDHTPLEVKLNAHST